MGSCPSSAQARRRHNSRRGLRRRRRMPLLGIETLLYGVDDLDVAARFYDDFGLEAVERDAAGVRYRLPEGSFFILRRSDDPSLPPAFLGGQGPREIIWGVDTQASL